MKKIVFVAAFKREVQAFLEKAKQVTKKNQHGFTIYSGFYYNCNIIFIVTGLGKSNAKLAVNHILKSHENISWFVNIGFAGALTDFYDLGQVVQAGALFNCAGELLEAPNFILNGLPLVKLICSHKVIDSHQKKGEIMQLSDADIVDMESEGFIKALKDQKVKVSVIKIISDYANEQAWSAISTQGKALSSQLEKTFGVLFKEQLGQQP